MEAPKRLHVHGHFCTTSAPGRAGHNYPGSAGRRGRSAAVWGGESALPSRGRFYLRLPPAGLNRFLVARSAVKHRRSVSSQSGSLRIMSGESNDPSAYPALAEAVDAVHEAAQSPLHPAHSQHHQPGSPQDQQPPPPQEQPSQHEQHEPPVSLPLQYGGLQATAVAHHGLQALEAATAAAGVPIDPVPLAQQYAQSASMHVTDSQYEPMTPQQPVSNGLPMTPTQLQPPPQSHPSAQKVTRLRRACDMCSSRKVKVGVQARCMIIIPPTPD